MHLVQLEHPLMSRWQIGDNSSTRVVYDPTWCEERPYKTYIWGTAKEIFVSLHEAIRYLGEPDITKWRFVP